METFIILIAAIATGLAFIGPKLYAAWTALTSDDDDWQDAPSTVEQRFRNASGEDAQ
jgi:hypothetical protein